MKNLQEILTYSLYVILALGALLIAGCKDSSETELASPTGIGELHTEGRQIPSFNLPSLQSGDTFISSDSFQGKVVLVSFFASWCRSCLEEIPLLKKLQNRFSDQGFSLIAMAIDHENKVGLKNLIQKRNINYPVLLADEAVKNDFGGIAILPTMFLVDREGKLLKKYSGHIERESLVQDIKQNLRR
jgi:peroxiredoxin